VPRAAPTQPAGGGRPLPPVNYNSSLVADHGRPPSALLEAAVAQDSSAFNFGRLAAELNPPNVSAASIRSASMRKISSAPVALNTLGGIRGGPPSSTGGSRSGGPMRRVATSINLPARRSNAFMWTMEMHRDFENAVQTLVSRGRDVAEITAAEVIALMKYSGAEGLTELSIQRHLEKRMSLQQKLTSFLPPPAETRPDKLHMAMPPVRGNAPAVVALDAAGAASAADSLNMAMQRQQAMARQLLEQQRTMQMQATST